MKNKLRFSLYSVVPIVVLVLGAAWIQSAGHDLHGGPTPPQLDGPSCALDLGNGKPGETLEGQLILANAGGRPLQYELKAGCGCTGLTPSSGTIDPGKREAITVSVTLPSDYDTARRFYISAATNDPEKPEADFLVQAKCPALFKTEPENLDFGSIPADGPHELAFSLRDGSGAALSDEAVVKVEADRQDVEILRVNDSPHDLRYLLRLPPELPPGFFQCNLRLTNVTSDETATRPITAYFRDELTIAPRVIFVPNSAPLPYERMFLVRRSDGRSLGQMIRSTTPAGVTVTNASQGTSSTRQFRLTVSQPFDQHTDGIILMHFEGTQHPALLRLRRFEAGSAR